ncbi:hypothetical protein [Ideonella sp.]|uniref:hypothetical protein n=1 Tax=Ideonella sp. TaxID=1929293 RepID=UPI0035B4C549
MHPPPTTPLLRSVLLAIGLAGVALFGAALLLSWVEPLWVERAAREVVRIEVEQRVGEKIDTLSNSKVAALAAKALGRTEAEIDAQRRALKEGVPAKTAQVVADMLHVDCECRRRMSENATRATEERIGTLDQVRARLLGLIETAYASVTQDLMREFRIFCGSNAGVFGLLALVTWFWRRASVQLVVPALVLLGAAGLTGGLYLFNQNWLHTIVFSEYVGMGYVAYLGGAFALLADVAFNRARCITAVLNVLLDVVGSATVLVPC